MRKRFHLGSPQNGPKMGRPICLTSSSSRRQPYTLKYYSITVIILLVFCFTGLLSEVTVG